MSTDEYVAVHVSLSELERNAPHLWIELLACRLEQLHIGYLNAADDEYPDPG